MKKTNEIIKNARDILEKYRLEELDTSKGRKLMKSVIKKLTEAAGMCSGSVPEEIRYLLEECAAAMYSLGDMKGMEECLRLKAGLEPGSADAFLNMGYYYEKKGMTSKALNSYKEGLEANFRDEYIYYNLASLLKSSGSPKKAMAFIKRAMEENPGRMINFILAGDICCKMEDYTSASDYYEKAVFESKGDLPDSLYFEAHMKYSYANLKLESPVTARVVGERAILIFPEKKPEVLEVLGMNEEDLYEYVELTDILDNVYYEGEYKNGSIDGWGILYDPDQGYNAVKYVGEFIEGKYHGYGLQYHKNGKLKYSGNFKDDMRMGEGRLYSDDGELIYEGTFENGIPNGIYDPYIKMDGMLRRAAALKNGNNILYNSNGTLMYEGNIYNGKFHGFGKKYGKNGNLEYKGQFKNGLYDGFGYAYYEDGKIKYDGLFREGRINGRGKYYNEDGSLWYKGEFENDVPHVWGQMYYKDGSLMYEGCFSKGQFYSNGREYYKNGKLKFEGKFKMAKYFAYGERNYECGTLYDEEGKILFEGDFSEYRKKGGNI